MSTLLGAVGFAFGFFIFFLIRWFQRQVLQVKVCLLGGVLFLVRQFDIIELVQIVILILAFGTPSPPLGRGFCLGALSLRFSLSHDDPSVQVPKCER